MLFYFVSNLSFYSIVCCVAILSSFGNSARLFLFSEFSG